MNGKSWREMNVCVDYGHYVRWRSLHYVLEKYQWTRIIDSLGSTQPDEAAFKSLPNGDDLEYGTFSKDGVPTSYEEVWRDVTEETSGERSAWILQSNDGSTFLGKVGSVFLGMHQDEEKNFAVRKEVYSESKRQWETVFENGSVYVIPTAASTAQIDSDVQNDGAPGGIVHVNDAEFVIRGLGRF